uniref:Uncharacterized protein n=1 Tax=Picea glauca TaxID=3330 RepID=A0A101M4Q3_PICGL|nr:hypothetical protein ABT39_MTgene2705 [Picea glauca]KUM46067.1 hypothetical protein ABT39_MTgene1873 [Picea glauca]KUM51046.1 hypothetical protein ABT39_MTgene892 [Picea glauca]
MLNESSRLRAQLYKCNGIGLFWVGCIRGFYFLRGWELMLCCFHFDVIQYRMIWILVNINGMIPPFHI